MTKREVEKSLKKYPAALTVGEVAEILRVSTKTVYKMIKENTIPAAKVGRELRVAKSRLVEYLRSEPKKYSHPPAVSLKESSDYHWTYGATCGIVRVGQNKSVKGAIPNGKKSTITGGKRAG